jgi:hypothetical protein
MLGKGLKVVCRFPALFRRLTLLSEMFYDVYIWSGECMYLNVSCASFTFTINTM